MGGNEMKHLDAVIAYVFLFIFLAVTAFVFIPALDQTAQQNLTKTERLLEGLSK
jgi:hypothetical protein